MFDNYLYRPKLSNGNRVSFSWPIAMYRYLNIMCWPLAEDVPPGIQFIYCIYWLIGFLIFLMHNDSEFRYLRFTHNELDNFLTGVPTYLILLEVTIRIFALSLRKHSFRRFLKRFYSEIYIDEELTNSKTHQSIQRKLWPTYIIAFMYSFTLLTFTLMGMWRMNLGKRETLYKMILPFEYTSHWLFGIIILCNIWVGIIVVSHLAGETTILTEVILHLNARYLLMRDDLHNNIKGLLMASESGNYNQDLAGRAYAIIVKTINRSVQLKQFSETIQKEFSFSIFVMMSFSALLLCALGFKVYTNPVANVNYILWILGKILEMLVYGEVGSTIMITTDKISSMFYESQWELVLMQSTNESENLHLLKTIYLAMTINHKPFHLVGMNFFGLSKSAVVKILQGAGSYFTCLISFR